MILIISGVSLIVSKWNDSSINKRIQDICTSIKIYSSHDNVSTELSFEIAYDYNDYYFINLELGDDVWLYVNGAIMFSGKITDIKFNSETNTHEITCYDMAWYICKNNITYNFEDVSVNDAITYVISELEIERYDFDKELQGNGNIRIGNHLIKNQPANKVLMAICGEITKLKGIYYYIHMNQNGRVVISECDKYYSGITIQKSSANVVDGNLISYTISKSMQNMVNQIKLYSPEYELLDTFNTIGFNRRQFGIIQDTEMLDTGDDSDAEDDDYKKNYSTTGIFSKAVEKIKQRLEKEGKPEVDLNVVCLGDVNYKVGYGVMVRLPETVYNDVFCYITAVEHNFTSDGNFISKLTLSLSKRQELVEWDDIEEKRDEDEEDIGAEGGSTNSIIESACNWAVKIAEDNTHGYSQARRWSGIDFDCSSFVISAFEQAGLKLRENGANTTYDMIKGFRACGFEDIHNFTQSDLVRGDVLLNVDHHTCLYIGDGKVANCSSDRGHPEAGDQDGTEIRVQDYYVYPEGGWNCILRLKKVDTDKTTVRGDSSIDSAINANSQAEFAKIVAPFAQELYKTYHIFPSTIISCMIQESWTGDGFTRLAKNHFNFGGVKCSASSENAVQDYKPPASEGSMLYRHFNTLKEFMTYWCELISGRTGMNVYKVNIADKNTAKEQCYGFDNTPYAGDPTKGGQMWRIVQQNALEQYNQ